MRTFAGLGAGRRIGAQQRDGLPDRFLDQRIGAEQIIIVILFDDADIASAQPDRFRADQARHIGKFLARDADGQGKLAFILNQRDAVRINRDCDIALRAALTRCLRR